MRVYIGSINEKSPFVYNSVFWVCETLTDQPIQESNNSAMDKKKSIAYSSNDNNASWANEIFCKVIKFIYFSFFMIFNQC